MNGKQSLREGNIRRCALILAALGIGIALAGTQWALTGRMLDTAAPPTHLHAASVYGQPPLQEPQDENVILGDAKLLAGGRRFES